MMTPLSSGTTPASTWGKEDTIRSTTDNAALAKLLCVEWGYYNDLYLRAVEKTCLRTLST